MKLGDRKKFLNYIVFLTETEMTNSEKNLNKKKREDIRKKNSLKFGSSKAMKRVLDNFKSIPIYEESIKEECSYSSSSSQKGRGKNKPNAAS